MGAFIRHTALFLLCFALLLLAILLGTDALLDRASFRLPAHVNTIVVGDSHVECAIDDSILTRTANLSMAGDAYLYAHAKLRRFLAENPQVDTVWLSYSYIGLERWQDTLTRSERYNGYKLPFHFFLLDTEDLPIFLAQPSFYTTLARTPYLRRNAIKTALKRPLSYNDLRIGGYNHLDRNGLRKDIARRDGLHRSGAVPDPAFGKAHDQVLYLKKIIDLCKEQGVACILINTPMHPVIARDSDTTGYHAHWRNELGGTTLWDHAAWTMPDSCFADATHLNHEGARRYSEQLRMLRARGWPATNSRGEIMEVDTFDKPR